MKDTGYQRILAQENGKAGAEQRACAFLDEKPDKPFFLDVGFGETHRRAKGFDPPPEGEPENRSTLCKTSCTVP